MKALLVTLLTLLVSCSVGRPPEAATGDEIYSMLCSNCHGADLEGGIGPPLGPGSNAATRPDSFLETTIINGRGRMPSFSTSLSERQLALLIDHIREVQQR
jgi:mono/diheme cytochrome c family protein